jgi:hypothetical protein
MKLDVIIPTYQRADKLKRTLSSLHCALEQCGEKVDVTVKVFYSDADEFVAAAREMGYPWLEHHLLSETEKEFSLPLFWNDRLRESRADAMCYITDDVLLNRYCLAIAAMEIEKLEFDGVIGFNIENITEPYQPCLAAFGVIGLKYADRFDNRQVFCPDYTSLYADIELQRQATILGRFKFQTACLLVHYHPAYTLGEMDATHAHTRRNFDSDKHTFEARSKRDLVWGLSYELLNA